MKTKIILELTSSEVALLRLAKADCESGWIGNPRYPAQRLQRIFALLEKISAALPANASTNPVQQ